VTTKKLGSMGTPVRVEVGGRAVFLCCEGCREAIEGNPAKYLARLPDPAKPAP
jgi:Cu(I)/Ag(I) efflux system membrane fusion protein